jgi:hypothetical protein
MTDHVMTPPQLARIYGVNVQKVLLWIKNGELTAINLAARAGGRPRWRIRQTDVEVFEARRQAVPPIAPQRRRQRADKPAGWVEYF